MSRRSQIFPFCAIVGQETLKTALLVNAVDPRVGGVLVRGEKGTAKSTAVRALAEVLPPIRVVDGCRFSCDPDDPAGLCVECQERALTDPLPVASRRPRVVELPVTATEDRVVGSLDMEHALRHGERRFESGLLAAANRGILYVDEVNLLDDHLVDTLLDSAAMGVNIVEREGVAFSHPARFLLVGTMNPEEGDVRPQLLDRFGLCADVVGLMIPEQRVEILERRAAFEDDPPAFAAEWEDDQADLEAALVRAIALAGEVRVSRDLLFLIATVCAELGVDGHRADLTMARAGAALSALEGRSVPQLDDVRRVAPLVLAHRMRRRPFEDVSFDQLRLDSLMASPSESSEAADSPDGCPRGQGDGVTSAGAPVLGIVKEADEVDAGTADRLVTPLDKVRRAGAGRRVETRSDDNRGRYSRSETPRPGRQPDVAVDATIRQAASRGRPGEGELAVNVEPDDVRAKVRKRRVGSSIVFCVDASGSMGAAKRMETAKGAVLELLVDAYRRRDRVGLVSFRGDGAEVLLAPTGSVELAQLKLKHMESGGATPIAAGIERALELIIGEVRREPETVPLVLVTDGRANVGRKGGLGSDDAKVMAARIRETKVHALLIDTTDGPTGGAAARELARAAGAEYVRLGRTDAGAVAGAVKERLEAV